MSDLSDAIDTLTKGLEDALKTQAVLSEVRREIYSAREKHGKQQGLPDGPVGPDGQFWDFLAADFDPLSNAEVEHEAKRFCQERPYQWSKILVEEVAESIAAKTPEERRAELVQVAAMAVAWILTIDSRES